MPNFLKKIPVYNGDMTELNNTSPAKARILIRERKAKIICTHPFVIRLNYVKKLSDNDKKLMQVSKEKKEIN